MEVAKMSSDPASRYVRPTSPLGQFSGRFFNRSVAWLTDRGVSILGSRVLTVPGRSSGQPRSTPVNLLILDGERYLVSPRGQTQWVRNMRAAGGGTLRLGHRIEAFTATELADADKLPVLSAYLRRWKFEVGMFFDGVRADQHDKLREISPGYPVFRISPAPDQPHR
jgi:deazaflavin-dependent oxidoreductase (nitroreductase family)